MATLAVIPSDPLDAYVDQGIEEKIEKYYNPRGFFDKVFCLSPLEKHRRTEYGMTIIPTKDKQLKKRIKDLNVDIVRAYGAYWPSDMACYYKVSGVPVVVSVHDRRNTPRWLRSSIRKADVVFAVSQDVSELITSTYFEAPEKVWILPNRVDMDLMRPVPESELRALREKYPCRYRILHVGRKTWAKNIDTLLKALALLPEEYCLIAIGREENPEYAQMAKLIGVWNRCTFIDMIENKELPLFYSMADCVCNPSRTEAMSRALIEALSCGAIVITSNIAASSVNIKDGKNALVIDDIEDPEKLSVLIKTACTDSNMRDSIGRNARKSMECFSEEAISRKEVEYYKKILDMKDKGEFYIPLWEEALSPVKEICRAVKRRLG